MKKRMLANRDFFDMTKTLLDEGHSVSLTVKGHSMWPFYKNGITRVILKRDDDYRKGDVILFEKAGRYVLHRLIRIDGDVFITRGDNNPKEESLTRDRVHARVKLYGDAHHKHEPRNPIRRMNVALWRLIRPLWFFLRRLKQKWVSHT